MRRWLFGENVGYTLHMDPNKHPFEAITYMADGKRRTVILRDTTESGGLLTGTEVANDADGCGWHDVAPAGFDERVRFIDVTLIVRRRTVVESPTYGGLVAE